MRISELKIDPDFRDCLPKMTQEEFDQLEQNILEYGIQSPLIIWQGYIVDGHNRYTVCFNNNITDVPVREEYFESKDEVIQWILENQLGRRNLTKVARDEVALRYEEIIKQKAEQSRKEGNAAGGRAHSPKEGSHGSNEPRLKEPIHTDAELARIAGTSKSSIKRTKYILRNGTDEEIERARRGGKGNSQGTIFSEIKKRITPDGEKTCSRCLTSKPLSEFGPDSSTKDGYDLYCRPCRAEVLEKSYKARDKKKKPDAAEPQDEMTIPQIKKMLKDESTVPVVTENHIMEMVNANIDNFIKSISSVISMNESSFDSCKEKVKATIIARISEFCEERI